MEIYINFFSHFYIQRIFLYFQRCKYTKVDLFVAFEIYFWVNFNGHQQISEAINEYIFTYIFFSIFFCDICLPCVCHCDWFNKEEND